LEIDDHADFQVTDNFTLSAWLRSDEDGRDQGIVGRVGINVGGVGVNKGYALVKRAVNTLALYSAGTLGGVGAYLNSGSTYTDRDWHHLVAVRENGVSRLYVDGKLQAGSLTKIPESNPGDFIIGKWYYNHAQLRFNGDIDEVAFFKRPLSAAEVLQLYRRGANRLKYQVRSCDDAACSGESWLGPDGTAKTYFSELHNYTAISGSGGGSGTVQITPLELTFGDFNAAGLSVANNRYFQYRVIMESDDENNLCSGAPCLPQLTSVTAGPTGRYYGGSPSISNAAGVSYSVLSGLVLSSSGACSPTYQLSKNGSDYYYWNGTAWAYASGGVAHSSSAGNVSSNLSSFSTMTGRGSFFFRAFLQSNTTQSCELNSVDLTYTP
jgi:hypothetical protein